MDVVGIIKFVRVLFYATKILFRIYANVNELLSLCEEKKGGRVIVPLF